MGPGPVATSQLGLGPCAQLCGWLEASEAHATGGRSDPPEQRDRSTPNRVRVDTAVLTGAEGLPSPDQGSLGCPQPLPSSLLPLRPAQDATAWPLVHVGAWAAPTQAAAAKASAPVRNGGPPAPQRPYAGAEGTLSLVT